VVVEEVEDDIRQSAAIGGNRRQSAAIGGNRRQSVAIGGCGWELQGRAAKAVAAGGEVMPKWCVVCLFDEAGAIGKLLQSRYKVCTK
jgi:hypothetical protein